MFSLVYGFFEYLLRKDEHHFLLLGIDKAGKTNILEKLKSVFLRHPGLEPDKILPTVGLNVGRFEAFGAQLIFWDLGGQSGLRSIWDKYFDETHAVVYVVDASNEARLAESKAALDKVLGNRSLFGAPLLVFANKQDADKALPAAAIAEHLGVGRLDSRPCKVLPVSAFTGQGISEGVQWLVEVSKRTPRFSRLSHTV
jgi:ADP-ribosylation factor related protein 1